MAKATAWYHDVTHSSASCVSIESTWVCDHAQQSTRCPWSLDISIQSWAWSRARQPIQQRDLRILWRRRCSKFSTTQQGQKSSFQGIQWLVCTAEDISYRDSKSHLLNTICCINCYIHSMTNLSNTPMRYISPLTLGSSHCVALPCNGWASDQSRIHQWVALQPEGKSMETSLVFLHTPHNTLNCETTSLSRHTQFTCIMYLGPRTFNLRIVIPGTCLTRFYLQKNVPGDPLKCYLLQAPLTLWMTL